MSGRVGKPTGLSQAEPSSTVSALTGFDPSRMAEAVAEADKRLDAYAATLAHGLVVVVDDRLAPNEVRVHVGEDMYRRIREATR